MKIYLSGPMKGYPNDNYPLFIDVANQLRKLGHTVYNPAEFKHNEEVFPLRKAFSKYCKFICEEADTIVLLPGYNNSEGATVELKLAKICNLTIIEWENYNAKQT